MTWPAFACAFLLGVVLAYVIEQTRRTGSRIWSSTALALALAFVTYAFGAYVGGGS